MKWYGYAAFALTATLSVVSAGTAAEPSRSQSLRDQQGSPAIQGVRIASVQRTTEIRQSSVSANSRSTTAAPRVIAPQSAKPIEIQQVGHHGRHGYNAYQDQAHQGHGQSHEYAAAPWRGNNPWAGSWPVPYSGYLYSPASCDYSTPCSQHLWDGYCQNPLRCRPPHHLGCKTCGPVVGGCASGNCGPIAHGCNLGRCSNSLGRTAFGGGFGCNSCQTSVAPEATCAAPVIEEGMVGPIPTPAPVHAEPKLPRVPTAPPPAPAKPAAEAKPVEPAPVAEEPKPIPEEESAPMELQPPVKEEGQEAAPPAAPEKAPELTLKSSRRIARVALLPTLNAPR